VASRITLFVSVIAAGGLMAVSPLAVRVLFGREFDAAVTPLLLLLPGIIAGSATRVLGSYLFSQGKIIYNTWATFIALGVTIGLDVILIPWLEVEGAAIASSIAYTSALGATVYWYARTSGRSAGEALIVQASDLREYGRALRRLRGV
jgi:O-antigen/teichoic acid export membrane protein